MENYFNFIQQFLSINPKRGLQRSLFERLHLDPPLLCALLLLAGVGLIILYSASSQSSVVIFRQLTRFGIAFVLLLVLAQIPPHRYQRWAPWLFGITLVLLVAVLLVGHTGKGAQRWLNLHFFRFQPSEIMKLALPLMLAWYLRDQPLPLSRSALCVVSVLTLVPALLIAKQPDLGTALLITSASLGTIFFAGISWRLIAVFSSLVAAGTPIVWHFMHDYQRKRVLTFLNPENDPLGSGYHIIQSKIAIGSGGLYGKGWLNGTQSHLQFLPEHSTDFIFAVSGEEFGFLGSLFLLFLFLLIVARSLYIATQAQDTFCRLLAGTLSLLFFISVFVNMGMVSGVLPVVGIPLPLISYGGTSMVTLIASFGILMSIHTHRKLIAT